MKKLILLIGLIGFCLTSKSQVLQQIYSNDTTILLVYSVDSSSSFKTKELLKSDFTTGEQTTIDLFKITVNTNWKSNYQITYRTSLCEERVLIEKLDGTKSKEYYNIMSPSDKSICNDYKMLMTNKL